MSETNPQDNDVMVQNQIIKEVYNKTEPFARSFNDEKKWKDITVEFKKYCNEEIKQGEFKGDEKLSLAKVLHSVEVFNPFMDVGHLLKDNYRSEELFEAGKIKEIEKFKDKELIELFDSLFILEQLYFHGKMWNHTMKCCDYVNLVEKLNKESIGYVIVISELKTCSLYYKMVMSIGVEEEEMDFSEQGNQFITEMGNDKFYSMIDEVLKKGISKELKERLEFRKEYIKALEEIGNKKSTTLPKIPEDMKTTEKRFIRENLYARDITFVPNIRRYEIPTLEEIKKIYEKDAEEIRKTNELMPKERIMVAYCGIHKIFMCPIKNLLVRYIIREYVLDNIQEKIKKGMKEVGLNQQRIEVDKLFYERLGMVFGDIIKMMTHNQSYFYRSFSILLEVFEMTHNDAYQFDLQQIQKYPPPTFKPQFIMPGHYINGYLMQIKFSLMIKYLLIGISLKLYSDYEYHMIYWYISILFSMSYEHLNEFRIQLDMDRRMYSISKKSKNIKPSKLTPNMEQLTILLYKTLISGITKLLLALNKMNIIKSPEFLLGNNKYRYELRFSAFEKCHTPQYIPFEKYEEQRTNNIQPGLIIIDSINELKKCKEIIEEIKLNNKNNYLPNEMVGMLYKISMSNMLTAMKLMKIHPTSTTKAVFSFDDIDYLPIISIKDN
ncbi:hypothetical protein ENUP19_0284G0058 [Entamoeba nuttalli]|uniref:NAA35-like TPR repeats domain-containing protein n=1 Tax=Entamoeba nuttalli TaxID=412467 RepID=A0ABQ0DU01_9EUKA